jgi:hypothetical protein
MRLLLVRPHFQALLRGLSATVPAFLLSSANFNELPSAAFTSDDCDRRFWYGEVARQKFDQSLVGFAFAGGSMNRGDILACGDFLYFFSFSPRFN